MLKVCGCEPNGPEPFCAHHGSGNVERRWRHRRGRWGASPFWAGAVVVEIVAARVRWDLIFVAWQNVTVTLVVTVQTGRHVVGWCRHGRRPTWRCWWRNFDILQTWKKNYEEIVNKHVRHSLKYNLATGFKKAEWEMMHWFFWVLKINDDRSIFERCKFVFPN